MARWFHSAWPYLVRQDLGGIGIDKEKTKNDVVEGEGMKMEGGGCVWACRGSAVMKGLCVCLRVV